MIAVKFSISLTATIQSILCLPGFHYPLYGKTPERDDSSGMQHSKTVSDPSDLELLPHHSHPYHGKCPVVSVFWKFLITQPMLLCLRFWIEISSRAFFTSLSLESQEVLNRRTGTQSARENLFHLLTTFTHIITLIWAWATLLCQDSMTNFKVKRKAKQTLVAVDIYQKA